MAANDVREPAPDERQAAAARWRPILNERGREIQSLMELAEPEIGWYWQAIPPDPSGGGDLIRVIRSDSLGIQLAARLEADAVAGPRWVDRTGAPIADIAAYLDRLRPLPPPPPGLIQLQVGPPRRPAEGGGPLPPGGSGQAQAEVPSAQAASRPSPTQ